MGATLPGRSEMFWEADELDWQEFAACAGADPDLFFLERGGIGYSEGKKFCRQCPVRQECLDYAVRHKIKFGLWGGLAERQRRKL